MRGGILSLGKGRLSGACEVEGESIIVIRRGDALIKKRLLTGRRIIDEGVIGYDSDCYIFPGGRLTLGSEVNYDIQNQ